MPPPDSQVSQQALHHTVLFLTGSRQLACVIALRQGSLSRLLCCSAHAVITVKTHMQIEGLPEAVFKFMKAAQLALSCGHHACCMYALNNQRLLRSELSCTNPPMLAIRSRHMRTGPSGLMLLQR